MSSVEERQAELRRLETWILRHPTRANFIALAMALLFFGLCTLVLDSPPQCEPGTFFDGLPVPPDPNCTNHTSPNLAAHLAHLNNTFANDSPTTRHLRGSQLWLRSHS